MQTLNKLFNLQRKHDFVLFHWRSLKRPVRTGLFKLYDIRLQGLRYGDGCACMFSAACLIERRKSSLAIANVSQVVAGAAKGTLLRTAVKDTGLVTAPHVGIESLSEKNIAKYAKELRQLATTPYIPVSSIVMPQLLRYITDKASCKLCLPDFILSESGQEVALDTTSALALLGKEICDAVVVPQEYVYSGGMPVVPSSGIKRGVGTVYGMPGALFDKLVPGLANFFCKEKNNVIRQAVG